jgi:hypothetical protein
MRSAEFVPAIAFQPAGMAQGRVGGSESRLRTGGWRVYRTAPKGSVANTHDRNGLTSSPCAQRLRRRSHHDRRASGATCLTGICPDDQDRTDSRGFAPHDGFGAGGNKATGTIRFDTATRPVPCYVSTKSCIAGPAPRSVGSDAPSENNGLSQDTALKPRVRAVTYAVTNFRRCIPPRSPAFRYPVPLANCEVTDDGSCT